MDFLKECILNIETWVLFFSAYLLITLSPGPNVLLVIKNALKYGYKAAVLTIISNLFCQLLIIISIAFGAGALLKNSPELFFYLKVIGGGYLIYLGIKGLLNKSKASDDEVLTEKLAVQLSYKKVAKEAFIVSVSNPKTVIFLSAFLPQFLSVNSSVEWQFTIMFLTICCIVICVHLIYSFIAKKVYLLGFERSEKWSSLKVKAFFSRVTNSAFIAFGFGVLASHR